LPANSRLLERVVVSLCEWLEDYWFSSVAIGRTLNPYDSDRSDVFSLSANHISVYTHPWEAEPSLLKNSAIAQALVRRMKAERWPAVFECLNLTLFL